MEKSYDSARDNNNTNSSDQYLKQLNKVSHKISKPIKRTPFDNQQQLNQHHHHHHHHHQPPQVYNINKSDFRDVVQKLTGSPAHEFTAQTPRIHPHKPITSRLHSIRPPPLANVSSTKPSVPPSNKTHIPSTSATTGNENGRQVTTPLSPLPPFPAVNLAAESPISAYMRYLRSSPSLKTPQPQTEPGQSQFLIPNSPLGSGRIPSPSSFLLSPSMTSQLGFHQYPTSLSPTWRNL